MRFHQHALLEQLANKGAAGACLDGAVGLHTPPPSHTQHTHALKHTDPFLRNTVSAVARFDS